MNYDYCVIGGGILGLSTAMQLLQRRPESSLVLLEKERSLATHQTGHNSGVIHSGIYYEPGSLKARLCREGAAETKRFAESHGIPVLACGKLIVATTPRELDLMQVLVERASINGVDAEVLDAAAISEQEPAIRGLGALLIAETSIIDYAAVSDAMAEQIREAGGRIELGVTVNRIRETSTRVLVGAEQQNWSASRLVACAGAQSDRLARAAGIKVDFQIVPFRGEYFRLRKDRSDLVRHLVYPVPDPDLPFLGVHLTRTIDGGVTVGPNAVLGLAREGYRRFSFNARDVRELATFPGMWRLARHNARTGVREMVDSLFKRAYLARCRKYCPDLRLDDLIPEAAGIRAQAVRRDGTLVHDLLLAASERMLHVCNAPSSAATSTIPIGKEIVGRVIGGNG